MKEIIEFTIETQDSFNEEIKKSGKIQFQLLFEDGNCTDGYSFNPITGWENYKDFQKGWTEQDEDINELLNAIKDFSQSMECEQLIGSCTDVGDIFEMDYHCDGYVQKNKKYKFTVTIRDIENADDEERI